MLAHLKIEKNINMARELPLPPIMANAIQNFHLVFWTFFLVLPPTTVNWTILAPAAAESMETESSSEPAASSAEAPKEASPVKVWLCSFLPWTSHKKFISPMRNESRTMNACSLCNVWMLLSQEKEGEAEAGGEWRCGHSGHLGNFDFLYGNNIVSTQCVESRVFVLVKTNQLFLCTDFNKRKQFFRCLIV